VFFLVVLICEYRDGFGDYDLLILFVNDFDFVLSSFDYALPIVVAHCQVATQHDLLMYFLVAM
jgi:hypothetical protein